MHRDLLERWDREGWLLFERVFSAAEVGRVNAVVDELWTAKPRNVTVDDVDLRQRTRMSRLEDAQRAHRIKISDLYLASSAVRDLLLDPRLVEPVSALLGDTPVLCNSLNLEHGSAQEYHADSLYMTPHTRGGLVACWVALEDVDPRSGPLRFYPGSHRLVPFAFSNGGQHAIEAEMPLWATHMQRQLDENRAQPHVVLARAGDVVLWHADLLHGAAPIEDVSLTRRSIVAHYFTKADCARRGYRVAGTDGRHWVRRRPQPADLPARILSAIERRVERARAAMHRDRGRA